MKDEVIMIISDIIVFFYYSKNAPGRLVRKRGGIVSARRVDEINLIVNNLLADNDTDYNGWWFDHTKYDVTIQCFDHKWARCTKVR